MPIKKKVVWSPQSEFDFSHILEYLEFKWNRAVVNQFLDVTSKTIDWIVSNPRQFQFANKKRGIRKCVITKQNTIYFREKRNSIEVVRIFDTRQNPTKLKWT